MPVEGSRVEGDAKWVAEKKWLDKGKLRSGVTKRLLKKSEIGGETMRKILLTQVFIQIEQSVHN